MSSVHLISSNLFDPFFFNPPRINRIGNVGQLFTCVFDDDALANGRTNGCRLSFVFFCFFVVFFISLLFWRRIFGGLNRVGRRFPMVFFFFFLTACWRFLGEAAAELVLAFVFCFFLFLVFVVFFLSEKNGAVRVASRIATNATQKKKNRMKRQKKRKEKKQKKINSVHLGRAPKSNRRRRRRRLIHRRKRTNGSLKKKEENQ